MSLKVVSIKEDGVAALDCAEEMDALKMSGEFKELEQLLGPDWAGQRVALGFGAADYIDSAVIGWLLSLNKSFDQAGGRLVLHSMSPSVKRVITMMRLENVLNIAEDLPQAIEQLKEAA